MAFISVHAQDGFNVKTVRDTIPINLDNVFKLISTNILEESESVALKNFSLSKSDYIMNYRNSTFQLSDSLQYSIFDTLYITYKTIVTPLAKNIAEEVLS